MEGHRMIPGDGKRKMSFTSISIIVVLPLDMLGESFPKATQSFVSYLLSLLTRDTQIFLNFGALEEEQENAQGSSLFTNIQIIV